MSEARKPFGSSSELSTGKLRGSQQPDQESSKQDLPYSGKQLRWLEDQKAEYYRLKKIWDVPEEQEETEEIKEAKRKSLEILKSVKELKMEREPDKYGLAKEVEKARILLESSLNHRFEAFDSNIRFKLEKPNLPENLKQEHIDAINEYFGGKVFDIMVVPRVQELDGLSKEYVRVMMPPKAVQNDIDNGLNSFRHRNSNERLGTFGIKRFGFILKAMKEQLKKDYEGKLILVENVKKPNYDSQQGYVTSYNEPFVEIFKDVFDDQSGLPRFGRPIADYAQDGAFIKNIEAKIREMFKQKGLPEVKMKFGLVPAAVQNLQMTFYHPENSWGECDEWTGTFVGKRPIINGHRVYGGAGSFDISDVNTKNDCMARFAITFG